MRYFFVFLALFATASVAFFQSPIAPIVKVQPPAVAAVPGAESSFTAALDDFGLDEDSIPTDETISPKRKCGFCIG